MSRYDQIYQELAKRAADQAQIDLRTALTMAGNRRASIDAIERLLIQDLETDGPIFGKFIRSLSGAASSAVTAAANQGATIASLKMDREVQRLLSLKDTQIQDAIDAADPETLDEMEKMAEDRMPMVWVATLVNTCHRCLPLHGKEATKAEWAARNLDPETIHDGWSSNCKCLLVYWTPGMTGKNLTITPLVRKRVTDEDGRRIGKKTKRSILQEDIDKAQRKVEEALRTEAGRKILKAMGSAYADQGGITARQNLGAS